MTKLLVTGASGLLGLNLALEASSSHKVMGASRRALHSTPFEPVRADFLESGAVRRLLNRCQPEAVIHCAAAADVDYCERHPEEAQRVNADAAEEMAIECARRGIRLVHVSTDAVFDGQKEGEYTETDAPQPHGVYATSKFAGEQKVLKACAGAIVARVNFYGWSMSGRRSLGEFFVNNLGKGIEVMGFTDVIFCPMFVGHLAILLLQLAKSRLHGLYHAVGNDAMSKFDFGNAIARRFDYDPALIVRRSVDDSGLLARRAHNLRLDTSKLSTDLGAAIPEFSTGLGEFYRQYSEGYPQRIRSYEQAGVSEGSASLRPQENSRSEGR